MLARGPAKTWLGRDNNRASEGTTRSGWRTNRARRFHRSRADEIREPSHRCGRSARRPRVPRARSSTSAVAAWLRICTAFSVRLFHPAAATTGPRRESRARSARTSPTESDGGGSRPRPSFPQRFRGFAASGSISTSMPGWWVRSSTSSRSGRSSRWLAPAVSSVRAQPHGFRLPRAPRCLAVFKAHGGRWFRVGIIDRPELQWFVLAGHSARKERRKSPSTQRKSRSKSLPQAPMSRPAPHPHRHRRLRRGTQQRRPQSGPRARCRRRRHPRQRSLPARRAGPHGDRQPRLPHGDHTFSAHLGDDLQVHRPAATSAAAARR